MAYCYTRSSVVGALLIRSQESVLHMLCPHVDNCHQVRSWYGCPLISFSVLAADTLRALVTDLWPLWHLLWSAIDSAFTAAATCAPYHVTNVQGQIFPICLKYLTLIYLFTLQLKCLYTQHNNELSTRITLHPMLKAIQHSANAPIHVICE